MNYTKLNTVLTREVLFEKYNDISNYTVLTDFDTWNKSIDPHSISKAIKNLKKLKIQLYGEIMNEYSMGHLEKTISLFNVSHKINDVFLKNNKIYGDVTILDTPSGKIIQKLIDNKINIQFRIRTMGLVVDAETVRLKEIITWDIIN